MKKYLLIVMHIAIVACLTMAYLTTLKPITLDSAHTLVKVRWETPEGVEVMKPEVMPLWKYIEVERGGHDDDLRWAIEQDLHAHDSTFHRTHEEIDGKRW